MRPSALPFQTTPPSTICDAAKANLLLMQGRDSTLHANRTAPLLPDAEVIHALWILRILSVAVWCNLGAGQGWLETRQRKLSKHLDLICVHLESRRII